ncbi:NAD(P)-dependent oxidoreductase [Thioclava sp. GXIMD4216]|uniref:NAD-dependent epimerase/dehydratase family protein n=1 Tax=unclassified Thioclava TaxID=2621713 RepID=UPI0030CE6723
MALTRAPLSQRPLRLLAIGATGRLGRVLVPVWRRTEFGQAAAVELVVQARREGRGGDVVFDPLAEPDALQRAVGAADVVLGLAGVTAGSAEDMALNVTLAQAFCAAAQQAGKPVILASSASVYGRPSTEAPLAGRPFPEAAPLAPISEYGRAKQAMERMAQDYPACCCLRIGNVAGADALLGHAAPEGGRVLDVFAEGEALHGPLRSYIGPVTLAQAILRLARFMAAGASVPQVINLAEAGVVDMAALLAAAGISYQTRPAPDTAIARVELDVSRALALGLVPERPVRADRLVGEVIQLRGELS